MIERHVSFDVTRGSERECERFLEESYTWAMAQQPGFMGAAVLKPSGQESRYILTIRFVDEDSAAKRRASEEHRRLSPLFKRFQERSGVETHVVLFERSRPGG